MSTLDKTILLMIPSGYKATKLYSVLPEDGSGDFAASRGSIGHRLGSDKYLHPMANDVPLLDYSSGGCPNLLLQEEGRNEITYPYHPENSYWAKEGLSVELDVSTAGDELVINGNFATDSDWVKGAGTTISGGMANINEAANNTNILSQTSSAYLSPNTTYLVSYEIKNYVSGKVYFRIDNNYTDLLFGDSNKVFSRYIQTGSVASPIRLLTGATNVELSIDNVSIKEVQGFASPFKDVSGNVEMVGRKLVANAANPTIELGTAIDMTANADSSDTYIIKPLLEKQYTLNGIAVDFDSETYGAGIVVKKLVDGYYQLSLSKAATATEKLTLIGTTISSGEMCMLSYSQLEKGASASTPITPVSWTPGSVYTRLVDSDIVTVPAGVTKIIEIDSEGNENIITTIPTDYSIPIGRWSQIRMEHN